MKKNKKRHGMFEWNLKWQVFFTYLSIQILTMYGRFKDLLENIKSLIFIDTECIETLDEDKVN